MTHVEFKYLTSNYEQDKEAIVAAYVAGMIPPTELAELMRKMTPGQIDDFYWRWYDATI